MDPRLHDNGEGQRREPQQPACCDTVLLAACCGAEEKLDCCGPLDAPVACGCGRSTNVLDEHD